MYPKNISLMPLLLLLLLIAAFTIPAQAQAQDDRAAVRSILDKIGRKDDAVEDVAQFSRDGRVIQLNLNKRGLSGVAITEFPTGIFKLTALKGLLLKGNSLKSIPHEIGNMTELIELNLADNSDLGTLPASIGSLPNLQKLDIRYCGLTALPPEFGNLKKLEMLQLWGNGFTELPECVMEMTALKEIYLKSNKLATLPYNIIKLEHLHYIDTQLNYLCELHKDVEAWLLQREKRYKEHQHCDNVKHF